MADNAGPSNEEQHPYNDLVQQFKEICAVDDAVARMCIEQADGDLQRAVIRFLNGEAEPPPPPSHVEDHTGLRRRLHSHDSTSQSSSGFSTPDSSSEDQPERPRTWTEWFSQLLALPLQYAYYSFRQIFVFIFGIFGGFVPALTSPEEDVQTFHNEMETKYSDVSHPLPWYHSTYADVLNEAKASVRFLLVYLHNPSHQATENFIRNTLCSEEFKNFLERNGIIIWGTNVRTSEGYKVAQALREQNYPALCLISMRENRLACVQRVNGNLPKENLITALEHGVSLNQRFLNAILNERAQRELNNRLRREQEEEYQRSLEEDRRKMAERKRRESEHLENQRREEEEQRKLEEKRARFLEIRERIKAELLAFSEPDEDSVRVSVRFPSGAKFDRRFAHTDSLELLFNFVLVHEKCPSDFSLLSSYPRKELACAPEWYKEFGTVSDAVEILTFKAAGLENSAVVLVRDNDA